MHNPRLVNILLRISIASVLLYAAFASILQPYNWIGYFPPFIRVAIADNVLLWIFSIVQIALAIWVLSGWKQFFAAGTSALLLLVIIAVNYTQMDILFRDFAIFFAAGALVVGSYGKDA